MKSRINDIATQSEGDTFPTMHGHEQGQITSQWLRHMLGLSLNTSLGTEPIRIPLKLVRRDGTGEITSEVRIYFRDGGHAKAFDLLAKSVGLPKNTSAEASTQSSLSNTSDEELAFHLAKKLDPDGRHRLMEWLAELGGDTDKKEDELLRSMLRSSIL